ncbi:hypothetical protein BBG47_14460 [Paenibacillus sp. KS1]|nr:hypothetical protein BBG47_14460 [Paenibacillus sp. KS1]
MITKVLMCKPTYFDIEYSINPYMDVNNKVNKEKAEEQWNYAYRVLESLGIEIVLLDPAEGCPDMTFIGDAGIVCDNKFLASNFRHAERAVEVPHYMEWMYKNGLECHTIPDNIAFEGLGDVVWFNKEVLYGYGQRSSKEALDYVLKVYPDLNLRGVLHLKDDGFYHLGLAIALIDENTVLYYPSAFTDESLEYLRQTYERRIECTEQDAKEFFVCNNIPIGNKLIMDNCTTELEEKLNHYGYEVIKTDMSEFKKSGGSVRCLILSL